MSEKFQPTASPNDQGEGMPPGSGFPAGDLVSPHQAAWELLTNGMEAGLLLLDVDGTIRFATPHARAYLGIPDPEPAGKLPLLAEGNRIAIELARRTRPEEGVSNRPRRHFLQLGSEGERFLSMTLTPIRSNGDRCRWAVLLEDVTGVVRKGQEAADWAGNLIHDLKSPLSSVTGAVDLIFSGRLGPVDQKLMKFLTILRKGADRMVEMLEAASEGRPSGMPDLGVVKEVSFP